MKTLLHPTYFPNVASCAAMVQYEDIVFEIQDNYQKQTYRNRTHIFAANGQLSLTIPVIYSQNNRQLYKDIKIFNSEKWQANHWKSLLSAYRTSPYFEFYQDDLAPLFHDSCEYLLEFNLKCIEAIKDCLQWDLEYQLTETFVKEPTQHLDLRHLVNARKEKQFAFEKYTQVFSDRHGYLNNLSILDLLFNEGPNAITYLKTQKKITDLTSP